MSVVLSPAEEALAWVPGGELICAAGSRFVVRKEGHPLKRERCT